MAVVAVAHVTADGSKQQDGDLVGEAEYAEERGGFRQAIDEPELRSGLHPRADEGYELPHKEELEIAVLQGAEARGHFLESPPREFDAAAPKQSRCRRSGALSIGQKNWAKI